MWHGEVFQLPDFIESLDYIAVLLMPPGHFLKMSFTEKKKNKNKNLQKLFQDQLFARPFAQIADQSQVAIEVRVIDLKNTLLFH